MPIDYKKERWADSQNKFKSLISWRRLSKDAISLKIAQIIERKGDHNAK